MLELIQAHNRGHISINSVGENIDLPTKLICWITFRIKESNILVSFIEHEFANDSLQFDFSFDKI